MFCNKCGASLPADANFCHKCGAPVRAGISNPSEVRYSTASIVKTYEEVPWYPNARTVRLSVAIPGTTFEAGRLMLDDDEADEKERLVAEMLEELALKLTQAGYDRVTAWVYRKRLP